jgi:hypothetical protein
MTLLVAILSIVVLLTCVVTQAQADDDGILDRFGLSLGGSYGAGTMGNSGMDLQYRTMLVGSIQGLLSYRVLPNLQVGMDFDYSVLRQQTSLANAGGTNERGQSWTIGIGARYFINQQWAVQGSIGFFGRHLFDHPTALSQNDHLESPIAVRVKPQWFAFSAVPNLSIDLDLRYQRWGIFEVDGTEHSEATTQFFGGMGLTYHLGKP